MPAARNHTVAATELPTDLYKQLQERAALESRTRSGVLRMALRFYLEYAPVVVSDEIPKPLRKRPTP